MCLLIPNLNQFLQYLFISFFVGILCQYMCVQRFQNFGHQSNIYKLIFSIHFVLPVFIITNVLHRPFRCLPYIEKILISPMVIRTSWFFLSPHHFSCIVWFPHRSCFESSISHVLNKDSSLIRIRQFLYLKQQTSLNFTPIFKVEPSKSLHRLYISGERSK